MSNPRIGWCPLQPYYRQLRSMASPVWARIEIRLISPRAQTGETWGQGYTIGVQHSYRHVLLIQHTFLSMTAGFPCLAHCVAPDGVWRGGLGWTPPALPAITPHHQYVPCTRCPQNHATSTSVHWDSFACSSSTVLSRVRAHWHSPNTGLGAYTEKPFACITHIHENHRIIK